MRYQHVIYLKNLFYHLYLMELRWFLVNESMARNLCHLRIGGRSIDLRPLDFAGRALRLMVLDLTEPLDFWLRAHLHLRILALLRHRGLLPQLRDQVLQLTWMRMMR
jgi:hypothetical protein